MPRCSMGKLRHGAGGEVAGASRPSWVRFSCSSLFFFPPSLPPPFPSCKEYSLGIVLVTSRQVTDRPKPQWLQAPFYGAWFCRLVGHVAPLLAGLGHGAGLSWRRGLVLTLGSWCQWLGHLGPPPRGLPSRVPWTGSHGRCRPRGRVGFCKLSSGPDPEVTQHCFYHILPIKGSQGLARLRGGRNGSRSFVGKSAKDISTKVCRIGASWKHKHLLCAGHCPRPWEYVGDKKR